MFVYACAVHDFDFSLRWMRQTSLISRISLSLVVGTGKLQKIFKVRNKCFMLGQQGGRVSNKCFMPGQ